MKIDSRMEIMGNLEIILHGFSIMKCQYEPAENQNHSDEQYVISIDFERKTLTITEHWGD